MYWGGCKALPALCSPLRMKRNRTATHYMCLSHQACDHHRAKQGKSELEVQGVVDRVS